MESKVQKDGMGWIIALVIFVVLLLTCWAIFSYVYALNVAELAGKAFNWKDPATLGALGDFFGGTLNPTFAFFSLLLLIYTLQQNRIALSQGRDALEKTRESLDQGREAIEQSKIAVEQSREMISINAKELELSRDELSRSADTMELQLKQNKIQQLNTQFYSLYEYIETQLRSEGPTKSRPLAAHIKTTANTHIHRRGTVKYQVEPLKTNNVKLEKQYLEDVSTVLSKVLILVSFVEGEMKLNGDVSLAKSLMTALLTPELKFTLSMLNEHHGIPTIVEAALEEYGVFDEPKVESQERNVSSLL